MKKVKAITLGTLFTAAGLYLLGNQITQANYTGRVSDLEDRFRERVREINQENRENGITAQSFVYNHPVDIEIQQIIAERKRRLNSLGEDNSIWKYIPVKGDSLTTRLITSIETYSALGFLKN